jgi:hypothetical protein
MRFRFLLRQRLRGHTELAADRLGDPTIWHSLLGDGVVRLVPAASFQREAVDTGRIHSMYRWPEVLPVADVGGHALLRCDGVMASLGDALALALKARGVADLRAILAARTGMAALAHATISWLDDPRPGLRKNLDLAHRELKALLTRNDQ